MSLCRTTLSHWKHQAAKWKQWPASRRIEGQCLILTGTSSKLSFSRFFLTLFALHPLPNLSRTVMKSTSISVPPAYSQQVSQEAFLIAGLLLLTGLCDPLLVFGSVLVLFTRDTLLARCHGCHGLAAGSGWNWRAQPFNRDINNKYMYLIWPQARTKRILIWL